MQAFEVDNRSNLFPIQAIFRIDAGLGTRENVAWLIEMGYEVYTNPYRDWLTPRLKLEMHAQTNCIRVGSNAEMIARKNRTFTYFPYPLDVGLEHFYTGRTKRFGSLLQFGQDPVTTDLPTWFHHYNARQVIEAGIKEGKMCLPCTIWRFALLQRSSCRNNSPFFSQLYPLGSSLVARTVSSAS